MHLKTQIRKYATEWIENQSKGTVFHVYKLYDYLADTFPLECLEAGTVPTGETHYENDARQAIRDCKDRGLLKKSRKGQWKRGYWQRV